MLSNAEFSADDKNNNTSSHDQMQNCTSTVKDATLQSPSKKVKIGGHLLLKNLSVERLGFENNDDNDKMVDEPQFESEGDLSKHLHQQQNNFSKTHQAHNLHAMLSNTNTTTTAAPGRGRASAKMMYGSGRQLISA